MNRKDEAERMARLGAELTKMLEERYGLKKKGLGPALVVLGISLGARNGEAELVMDAVYGAATTVGIAPTMEQLQKGIAEDPEKLVQLLAKVTGAQVVRGTVEESRGKEFPWKR